MERQYSERSDPVMLRLADKKTRLADLTALIRAGEYHIPAEWVAEAILRWPGRAGRRA